MLRGGRVLLLGLSLVMPTALLLDGKASAILRLRWALPILARSALFSVARRDMAVTKGPDGVLPLLCNISKQALSRTSSVMHPTARCKYKENQCHQSQVTLPKIRWHSRWREKLRARLHLLDKGLQQAFHGKKLCIWHMGVQNLGWPIADTTMMSMPQAPHLARPAAAPLVHSVCRSLTLPN